MTDEGWSTTDSVLAGAAPHNTGQYDIARVIWAGEAPVDPDATDADSGETNDDRLLEALTAFATAVTESRNGEWADALDAAAAAEVAFDAVDAHGSVDTDSIERWLTAFQADPALAERSPPPTVTVEGDRPNPGELPLSAAAVVASAVAAARGDDPAIVADAVRFARQQERPEHTRYATFIRDYAGADASQRPIVFERLSGVVARERRKEDDVEGLFDS